MRPVFVQAPRSSTPSPCQSSAIPTCAKALEEQAHRLDLSRGKHEIIRALTLENTPHLLDIVACMPSIALRIQVAQPQLALDTKVDGRYRLGVLRVTNVSPRIRLSWLNRMPFDANIP